MPPSRLAGAARRRFSAARATAVYCAIMNPEPAPASAARKGGKSAHQRIHQPIDAALGHGGKLGERDAERIGAQAESGADGVRLRRARGAFTVPSDDGIVASRMPVRRPALSGGVRELLAHRAVHLRDGAQTQGILGAPAGARRENGAAVRERRAGAARPGRRAATRADPRPRRRTPTIGRADSRSSSRRCASAQSSRRSARVRARAVRPGGAGRAVDQTQSFLGLEHSGSRPRPGERLAHR